LYPQIKRRAAQYRRRHRLQEIEFDKLPIELRTCHDMVRLSVLPHFGQYITESSEHSAEYMPYWIKWTLPELIDQFNIPLDEYPRRCVIQISGWKKQSANMVKNSDLTHERSHELGSYIMEAIETGSPIRIHGHIHNHGLITNLPARTCGEVPCLVDRNGVQGC
jgi:alpha-galactosidase